MGICLILLGNSKFVSKWLLQNLSPPIKYENAHGCISSPIFDTVIISYMPISWVWTGVPLRFSLLTTKFGHLFMFPCHSCFLFFEMAVQCSCFPLTFLLICLFFFFPYWLVKFLIFKISGLCQIWLSFLSMWLFQLEWQETDELSFRPWEIEVINRNPNCLVISWRYGVGCLQKWSGRWTSLGN